MGQEEEKRFKPTLHSLIHLRFHFHFQRPLPISKLAVATPFPASSSSISSQTIKEKHISPRLDHWSIHQRPPPPPPTPAECYNAAYSFLLSLIHPSSLSSYSPRRIHTHTHTHTHTRTHTYTHIHTSNPTVSLPNCCARYADQPVEYLPALSCTATCTRDQRLHPFRLLSPSSSLSPSHTLHLFLSLPLTLSPSLTHSLILFIPFCSLQGHALCLVCPSVHVTHVQYRLLQHTSIRSPFCFLTPSRKSPTSSAFASCSSSSLTLTFASSHRKLLRCPVLGLLPLTLPLCLSLSHTLSLSFPLPTTTPPSPIPPPPHLPRPPLITHPPPGPHT
jgi:hypothetical protein